MIAHQLGLSGGCDPRLGSLGLVAAGGFGGVEAASALAISSRPTAWGRERALGLERRTSDATITAG
jgi:hypothetical protein